MELRVDGRRVRIERAAAGWRVEVEDRSYEVDAAAPRPGVYSLRIDGRQHEVVVRPLDGGGFWVSTADTSRRVEVADPLSYLAAQAAGGRTGPRRQRVTAYMPGRVAAVLVTAGQEVAAGTGVVVLEAMKMQNEILAEHAGTVTRIFVEPGQPVDGGDPLFELE
jgi:biotin carboxyl carrier protein